MEPISTATGFGIIRELLRLLGVGPSPGNDHDLELYDQYKALFIKSGAAEFFKGHDFLSSFEDEYWRALSKYVDNWHTVEHEFVDRRVNRAQKKVYKSAMKLGQAVAKYTVTFDVAGKIRSVNPHQIKPIPENIRKEAAEINELRPPFAKAHTNFIRLANKRLRSRTK